MAKLKSYKRLITTDFKEEDQELVEQIGLTVNDAFNDAFFTLNGRVDLANNIYCTVKSVDVTVGANGVPINSTSMTLNSTQPVIGCQVLQATNQTNSAVYPTGAPFISYTQLDQSLVINHITGLQANMRYTLRIVAYN